MSTGDNGASKANKICYNAPFSHRQGNIASSEPLQNFLFGRHKTRQLADLHFECRVGRDLFQAGWQREMICIALGTCAETSSSVSAADQKLLEEKAGTDHPNRLRDVPGSLFACKVCSESQVAFVTASRIFGRWRMGALQRCSLHMYAWNLLSSESTVCRLRPVIRQRGSTARVAFVDSSYKF